MTANNFSRQHFDEINKLCYNNRAEYWNRFPYPEDIPKLVQTYAPHHLGNKVLDIGSGTGVLASWLKNGGWDVLCLDPSEEMVRRCKEKGLTTQETIFQEFSSSGQFAMVFAILTFIHLPKNEWAAQIDKLSRMIPEGGLFFLGMIEGNAEGLDEIRSEYPRFFTKYPRNEIPPLFEKYFTLLEFRASSGPMVYLLYLFKRKQIE